MPTAASELARTMADVTNQTTATLTGPTGTLDRSRVRIPIAKPAALLIRLRRRGGGVARPRRDHHRPASRMALSRCRSLVVARRIARSSIGAATREKPDGLPRLRSLIRVPAPP